MADTVKRARDRLLLLEGSAPTTPPAGKAWLYFFTDSRLYYKDDAGVEYGVWRSGDTLLVPDGAVGTPSLAFSGDTNTGIYRSAADVLDFATGGVNRLSIGTDLLASGRVRASAGSLSKPHFNNGTDEDNGLFFNGTNSLQLVAGALARLTVDGPAGQITAAMPIVFPVGTAGAPSFTFLADNDTGIYRPGANQLAITSSGLAVVTFENVAGISALTLNGTVSNWLQFGTAGLGIPALTTRSAGTKLVLYNSLTGAILDYAIGVDGTPRMWFSANAYRWYGQTPTQVAMDLVGTTGQLSLPFTGATGGLLIGGDANLYRSAANVLKTDDVFSIGAIAAPADGDIATSSLGLYFDDTATRPKIMAKVKDSAGAVSTHEVSGPHPYCHVRRVANQAAAHNTTVTISPDTEDSDKWGMHASGVFTIPTGWGGRWRIIARTVFTGGGTTGYRQVWFSKNAVEDVYVLAQTDSPISTSQPVGMAEVTLNAGDAIRIRVFQNSTVSVNMTGEFSLTYVGPA